jgi:choline kinase
VTAIILAAGVARRLAPLTDRTQKSLLPVAGRAILARMLDALHAVGVPRVVIVVGHAADQVRSLAGSPAPGMTIECIHNPDYQKGSALSLHSARAVFTREPTLIMDADVVFPREFLRRLLDRAAEAAVLIDEGFADTGEEVKIYVEAGRVVALGKKIVPPTWDRVGEGIGFFKCGPATGRVLAGLLEQVIEESQGIAEYEDALHLLVSRRRVEAVDVTGWPWTEVDFAADLHRAESLVYPAIARLEGP